MDRDRVTIREAATLLDVHPNTVRNRLRSGMYTGEKVHTERGETWMIDVNSLTTNTPASAQQQLVSRLPDEALQILAREIVKEAGLAQDSERMAEIEQHRARFEYSKTLMLLYLALLASMGAVTALIENPQDLYLLYIAVAAGLVGLVVTNFATSIMPGVIGMPVFDRVTGFISVATSAWFSADVLLFVLFLYANI